MKNILAENMLRFGVKNLNETVTNKLRILAEQDQTTVPPPAEVNQKRRPLIPTTFKSFIAIFGQEAYDALSKIWTNTPTAPGELVYIPTKQGMLGLVWSTGDTGVKNAVLQLSKLVFVQPVSVTIPATSIKQSSGQGLNPIAGQQDIKMNFVRLAYDSNLNGDNVWVEDTGKLVGKLTAPDKARFEFDNEYTWEEAVVAGAGNPQVPFIKGQLNNEKYYKPMITFASNLIDTNGDAIVSKNTEVFKKYLNLEPAIQDLTISQYEKYWIAATKKQSNTIILSTVDSIQQAKAAKLAAAGGAVKTPTVAPNQPAK